MANIDIGDETDYPSSALSNFTPYLFTIDGIECSSMEGFLQSLKFSDPDMQREVCKLVGKAAKFKGKKKKWYRTQTLYWQGEAIPRASEEYQELLDRAFDALSRNKDFQKALLATGDAVLTHSMGKKEINRTILTEQEFISRLNKLRNKLNHPE